LSRYGKTRGSKNWQSRTRKSNAVPWPQKEFTRRGGRFQKPVASSSLEFVEKPAEAYAKA
jgi:hypothetical protein